jgi:hypothetical protein
VEPIIAPSARRHGVDDEDTLHAWRNPIRVEDLDEGFTMIVGPRRDGGLIEVGFVLGELGPVIVHALDPARPQYLP